MATTDLDAAVADAEFVIIATPTHYDPVENYFDTSGVQRMSFKVITSDQGKTLMRRCTVMYCSRINNSRNLFFRA